MKRSRVFSAVVTVGLTGLLTNGATAQLADYIWNPALTGPRSWQVDTNWTAPTFPGGYPYTIPSPAFPNDPGRIDSDSNTTTGEATDGIVYPSVGANITGVGANLNLDVGASNVTVASLNMGGTSGAVATTVSSTGGKLVFENYEVNLTAATFNPQVCAFNCGAAQITSGGAAGATNTISAPIQINAERLEFSAASTNNLTISGPITFFNYATTTNGQSNSSIRSFMPAGTKATISGSISLVDTATPAGATLTILDNGQIPPATTNIQSVPSTGTIEISGVIQDTAASGAPFGSITIGTTSANQALGTLILSGANTFRGTTTLNRANLVLANDSALGVDSILGDDRNGGATFAGNQNPSGQFGFNISSDNDSRTISVDARISQWLTINGTRNLTWAGLMTQGNTRGIDNLLLPGKIFTISGPTYGSSIASTEVAVENRIFTFDGTGTTAVTGGLHDKIKGGVSVVTASGLGHFRKAGTGTVLISDPGSLSDFTGDVIVDQGVMRFSSDAIFDQSRYVTSTGGAIGVDTGTFTNTVLLQGLYKLSSSGNLNHGGLMLTTGEAAANIDFTSGDLASLTAMSVAPPQNGISYTGTITPANSTYRLGGGNGVLTVPTNKLTGANGVQVTNGGEVALTGANTYTGVTRIQAKYHTTTQDQAIANTTTNISGTQYEGTTLTVNTLLNGGVNSSIGSSSNAASNLVIQGSTLKYAGSGANGTTDRLFTVGTGGATLEASGTGSSAMNFTNTGALAMGLAVAQTGSIFDTGTAVPDGISANINTRSRVNVQSVDDLVTGMTVIGASGVLTAGPTINAINNPTPTFQNFQVTIGTAFTGAADSGVPLTFGGVARTLTLTTGLTNTADNTLSPLIANATAAAGTNTVNVAKSGPGKWILTGNNTYTGTTTVNAGTLLINGNQSSATGAVTVAADGTLGGTGTIGGAITNNGKIAPGASVGTLNVLGNVTDGANSSWVIELSGASADKLAVTGNIDLLATDTLTVLGAGTGSSWLIGTYTGTLSGVFDTITSGYSVSYTGGNITLSTGGPLPGDLNGDGHVNAADYVYWRINSLPISSYNAWRANFGSPPGSFGASSLSAAVPEPASIWMAGFAVVVTIGGLRRGGRSC